MRLLQKEKQPKRRTPPGQAAGLRALPLEPGLQIPRTLHLPISGGREVQALLNRRNSESGASQVRASGRRTRRTGRPRGGGRGMAAGGAARRPWARKAAAPSLEKAAGAGRREARRPASRGTPRTVPGPRLPPQLLLCSHQAPREGTAAKAGTSGTPASDSGLRRRPRSNSPPRASIG